MPIESKKCGDGQSTDNANYTRGYSYILPCNWRYGYSLNVSLAYYDFPLPYHNLELNADLNYNYDNASRHHLSLNIHYQILLAYSIQSLMYSLVFSTPLVSGLVSHMKQDQKQADIKMA